MPEDSGRIKEVIRKIIEDYVAEYQEKEEIITTWRKPLVGFADAAAREIKDLKEVVLPDHQMPCEILEDPTVIISYFIPFTENIGDSNIEGAPGEPSRLWATAYDETNAMMAKLNGHLISQIEQMGYRAAASRIAGEFSKDVLKSRWSQRHIARIAGLGTFGLNNMLITEKGCCGRYNSVVTSLPAEADQPLLKENCLYKYNGSCKVCVSHCTAGALKTEGFDRFRCHDVCSARIYGNDTCGKCVVNLPCTYKNPTAKK